jgi:hypothetical protein
VGVRRVPVNNNLKGSSLKGSSASKPTRVFCSSNASADARSHATGVSVGW